MCDGKETCKFVCAYVQVKFLAPVKSDWLTPVLPSTITVGLNIPMASSTFKYRQTH